jgi:hypothetical protein
MNDNNKGPKITPEQKQALDDMFPEMVGDIDVRVIQTQRDMRNALRKQLAEGTITVEEMKLPNAEELAAIAPIEKP